MRESQCFITLSNTEKRMIFTNFNVFGIVMKYGIKLLISFLKQSEFSEGNYGCRNEKFLNLISTHSLNIISFVISS